MQPLPRSTQAGRGQLAGPAPSARQVRRITVHIEQTAPGVLEVSAPFGWHGGQARNPAQLAHLVAAAFMEAQLVAYSHFRNGTSPTAALGEPTRYVRPRPVQRGRRPDVHDPLAWHEAEDGRWVSPSGRRFRPDSQVVQRVQTQLARMWESVPKEFTEESAS